MSLPPKLPFTRTAFHDSHSELDKLNAVILGAYSPGGELTVFNPLVTQNEVPEATLAHENIHQELMRATAFGCFFEFLCVWARNNHFVEETRMCFDHQWDVQEACATYEGMALIAHKRPDYLSGALQRLPSSEFDEAPYKEVYARATAVLPIALGSSLARLQAQTTVMLALAHCSLNNDCLVRFRAPQELTVANLTAYLETASPNRRFWQILERLSEMQALEPLVNAIQEVTSGARTSRNPVRDVIRKVAGLLPELQVVVTHMDIKRQHSVFTQQWASMFKQVIGADLEVVSKQPRLGFIPQAPPPPGPIIYISLQEMRDSFARAREEKLGLWTVVYMPKPEEMHLDIHLYPLGHGGNPVSEGVAAIQFRATGFRSGIFDSAEIMRVFADFPDLPHAITFLKWSWRYWDQIASDSPVLRNAVQTRLDRELLEESVQDMLAFRGLGRSASYFLMKYDDQQAMACVADPNRPGIYGLQYLAGDAGWSIFDAIVAPLGVHYDANLKSLVPHTPLLRLMAFPSFLQPDGTH